MEVVPNSDIPNRPAVRARTGRIYKFGVFEVRPETGELWKRGVRLKLQTKPLQVLEALLEEPGELVTREELFKKLWPEGTFVDFESGLNTATNRLRTALGDSADAPRYIETLPRLGYRFICPVSDNSAEGRPSEAVPVEETFLTPDVPIGADRMRAARRLARKYKAAAVLVALALILILLYAHSRGNFLRLQPTVRQVGEQKSGKIVVEDRGIPEAVGFRPLRFAD